MCDGIIEGVVDPFDVRVSEGVLPDGRVWPEDATELIELSGVAPTVEQLGDPLFFDHLRERLNR
ncbi:hypothetical protein [Bifidobacterium eulemuris]|uniref:Uncharacterized protein n=1 Tax=Bifidobacterium eulemuris TaxID=1765219 RepID=A0A261GAN9_9BIFI|nr:hypothetical protein [Bifidobacterium eulemuris]OZG68245.1 hypothetical protein BEUL_1258 [Bifidobacterium eulemuris]QOL31699.1 hypothetical protein BE0216_03900 [Bifidobacterium eulemuris]